MKLGEVGLHDPHAGVGKIDDVDIVVGDAAKLVGKKVKVRDHRASPTASPGPSCSRRPRARDEPLTAEGEAEKPTRAKRSRDAKKDEPRPTRPRRTRSRDEDEDEPRTTSASEEGDEARIDRGRRRGCCRPKKRTRRGSRGGRNRKKKPATAAAATAAAAARRRRSEEVPSRPRLPVEEPDAGSAGRPAR